MFTQLCSVTGFPSQSLAGQLLCTMQGHLMVATVLALGVGLFGVGMFFGSWRAPLGAVAANRFVTFCGIRPDSLYYSDIVLTVQEARETGESY